MAEEKPTRRSAEEILDAVFQSARDELARTSLALSFSGVAGGFTMGLTGLGVASMLAALGDAKAADMIARLFYPLGFIIVIIGRGQLFTENTLYPVALCLKERRWANVRETLRLWSVVLVANIIGAFLFATLMANTQSLKPEILQQLIKLGQDAASPAVSHLFWSGVVGGWMIALVAWVVSATRYTSGHVMLTWLITFVVGLGHFAHCIAGSAEILTAVNAGAVSLAGYLRWIVPVTAGNICGGVLIVTILNFGQVHAE
jgi:formate/nitrite transporter FocA (FNT family)